MATLTDLGSEAGAALKAAGQTIAVAESSTGGLISAALLAVPGASAYFRGGSVVYTRESRQIWLGITKADVEGLKPLTPEMALAFARKVRDSLGTTWGIAELGAAGPAGTRYGTGAGLSALAVAGPVEVTRLCETGSDDREANMWAFTEAAMELLSEALAG